MIATMISGRLKEPATRRLTEKAKTLTSAIMIAADGSNCAQVIALETIDDDLGRALRKLTAGELITVTGEATVLPLGRLKLRVRSLTTIQAIDIGDITTPDRAAQSLQRVRA